VAHRLLERGAGENVTFNPKNSINKNRGPQIPDFFIPFSQTPKSFACLVQIFEEMLQKMGVNEHFGNSAHLHLLTNRFCPFLFFSFAKA
jgi:hypothetical protein